MSEILVPAGDGTHRVVESDDIRALIGFVEQRDQEPEPAEPAQKLESCTCGHPTDWHAPDGRGCYACRCVRFKVRPADFVPAGGTTRYGYTYFGD